MPDWNEGVMRRWRAKGRRPKVEGLVLEAPRDLADVMYGDEKQERTAQPFGRGADKFGEEPQPLGIRVENGAGAGGDVKKMIDERMRRTAHDAIFVHVARLAPKSQKRNVERVVAT